ncbi:hypothetical protein [Lactobacillus gasseri]|jgi:hypothetical protein|uniref:hypothetical protein n=1 Tax=Lactobacillus gasseri TaxID=1596 RepID=UPI000AA23AC5|nr:hypothetical protein [Lactobacillus gasseri]
MIIGKRIPNGTVITVDAKTYGPQYRYRIKGTHTFIDASNIKEKPANLLPNFYDLDSINN